MESLSGGRADQIFRGADGVHRPTGTWSENVHLLLRELRHHGFTSAPTFLRFDEEGREVLTFIPGVVGNDPLPEAFRSKQALVSAAKMLRAYHDASAKVAAKLTRLDGWQLPAQLPAEVICHGDFAPYNVVLDGSEAVGLIDFDVAHPAPRAWDVAYALYRWAPLTAPTNHDGFGSLDEQILRARLFCETYQLTYQGSLSEMICRRLNALILFMTAMARANDRQYSDNIADGHLALYVRDVEYIELHHEQIDQALAGTLS